ncbi:metal ABC transporter solute-binding protein, Zn/Mn family [Microbacterium fluvii]|uniref:Metal ABC transporter solute-binding protein, Zn/Mn family n=1 Tax=Microbacterium fluvii TaxID=415215 RepID=A0ABW2HDX8_9MICO|nr:zinc ABC transporter substrate-binding protein [Microbacterium fluvii]MCU4672682.1 zinc ABC transporter substrate-binding protein [Microbacterium fluvii]
MTSRRLVVPAALAAASALVLTGCAGDATTDETTGISVVTSTNVYGDIASAIGGDLVSVTAIIDSGALDPHSYEVSARDELTISRADLIVSNGGGYDPFVDTAIEATAAAAPQLLAVEYSHDWPENEGHDHDDDASAGSATEDADDDHDHDDHAGHDHVEGFNEHVWYDPHTVEHLAEAIADELGDLDPANAETYAANLAEFTEGIEGLESDLADIAAAHGGEKVFVTEPVPLYLTAAAELENVTPDAFSEAVEEGNDVAPATLLESMRLIDSGDVAVVIANAQTGGAETTTITDEAQTQGIPVLEFTETLPDGQTYLSWMQQNIAALMTALSA